MSSEDTRSMIQKEVEKEHNKHCAECFTPDPGYVSLNLGVFVCQKCAKFHKKLSIDRNNIIAVRAHMWTADQLTFIQSRGNLVVNQAFEKYLPKYYHRPDGNDPPIIREQFIKAKYEREEFKDISKQEEYNRGSKTGSLFKRGKDADKFLRRKFILREPEGTLEYYIKYSDRVPKDTITIRNLVNIYMVPDKVGNVNGMQVTYEKEGVRRNLFLFGENGKVTSDWYHAIRASMVRHKFHSFPDDQLKKHLNAKITKEGWMSKTGPKRQERFRKRWFSLVGTMVWYSSAPLDPHPLGFIPLGSKSFGYGVNKGLPAGIKVEGYGLTVHTPERVYALNCVSLESRENWLKSLTEVLDSCTKVWTPKDASKQKNSPTEVANVNGENAGGEVALNPSAYTSLSKKYRPCADSESSTRSRSSKKKPLFEKNANKGGGGGKYAKKKQGSMKRQSTTKKVQENPDDSDLDQIIVDYSDDDGLEATTKFGSMSDDGYAFKAHSSKKYSDDSEEDDEDDRCQTCDQSLSSSYSDDSESDIISSRTTEISKRKDYDLLKEIESANSRTKAPEKPPRQKALKDGEFSDSGTSNGSPVQSGKCSSENSSSQPPSQTQLTENLERTTTIPDKFPTPPPPPEEDPYSFADAVQPQKFSAQAHPHDDNNRALRTNVVGQSIRRVQGPERMSVKKPEAPLPKPEVLPKPINTTTCSVFGEQRDNKPRPVDFTLTNEMEEGYWFMVFQCETEIDDVQSYITPWIGAPIAEKPASIGPIRIPDNFEIAVIDTAPGGFGIQRTTGPFHAEAGDVWEVETEAADSSAPEMYYCEGMETDDGSIVVYANAENAKKFEVAMFKNGRKLFSRKGITAGEAVSLKVQQALYIMAVDEEKYFELEGQDLKAREYVEKASCIDINYRHPRMKVVSRKRGDNVFFKKA